MNRKILALVLALVAVAAAIVLAVTLNKDTPHGNASGSMPSLENNETTPDVPGVEDSVFGSEPVETKPAETMLPSQTEDPAASTTEHENTIPTSPADPDAGLREPDADIPEDTSPAQTEPAVTEPAVTEPQPTEPAETVPEGEIDYETFMALEPAVQRAYMESFESIEAFFEWYNTAKETYEKEHPAIDVGDGVIDLGDLLG